MCFKDCWEVSESLRGVSGDFRCVSRWSRGFQRYHEVPGYFMGFYAVSVLSLEYSRSSQGFQRYHGKSGAFQGGFRRWSQIRFRWSQRGSRVPQGRFEEYQRISRVIPEGLRAFKRSQGHFCSPGTPLKDTLYLLVHIEMPVRLSGTSLQPPGSSLKPTKRP